MIRTKKFYLPGSTEYSVEITATDDGTVSVSVGELDYAYNSITRMVNYYDIPVQVGVVLNGVVPAISDDELENSVETTFIMPASNVVITAHWTPKQEPDVVRLYGNNRCSIAIKVADKLKEVLGKESFDTIIIANGDNFADALTGSYLANVKGAPILLYRASGVAMNEVYIQNNLSSDGIVYAETPPARLCRGFLHD